MASHHRITQTQKKLGHILGRVVLEPTISLYEVQNILRHRSRGLIDRPLRIILHFMQPKAIWLFKITHHCNLSWATSIPWNLYTTFLKSSFNIIPHDLFPSSILTTLLIYFFSPNYVIQGVSRLEDITGGGNFLGLCDQKSSYKHVSDFGRLRNYGRF